MKNSAIFLRGLLPAFTLFSAELYLARYLAHSTMGTNITAVGMYWRDVFLPILLGAILCCYYFIRAGHIRVQFSRLAALLHLTAGAMAAGLLFLHPQLVRVSAFLAAALHLISGVVFFATSLPIFLDFRPALKQMRKNPRRTWMALMGITALVLFSRFLEANWFWLIALTGKSVFLILKTLGLPVLLVDMAYAIGIRHPYLNVSINMSCAGLEGMVFIFFALCNYFFITGREVSGFDFLRLSLLAAAYMFVANLIRIVVFFSVAAFLNQARYQGSEFFSWAFHANIGWMIYLLAIAIFLSLLHRSRLKVLDPPASHV